MGVDFFHHLKKKSPGDKGDFFRPLAGVIFFFMLMARVIFFHKTSYPAPWKSNGNLVSFFVIASGSTKG